MVEKKFHSEVSFTVVPTWKELLDRVKLDPPSVVLVDLSLGPTMGSADTIFAFSKIASEFPPAMVLTGQGFDLELRKKCILAGFEDFMLKDEANRNPELLCERIYHCYLRRLRDEQRT